MIVLKFGGSSIESSEKIHRVIEIAHKQIDRSPLLVFSAMGKTTNRIEEIIGYAEIGEKSQAWDLTGKLKDYHMDIAKSLVSNSNLHSTIQDLNELFMQFSSLVKGLILLHECSPRSRDALLSFGELLSTTIIHSYAINRGIRTELLDSREFIITDENFNSAIPLMEKCQKEITEKILCKPNQMIIMQGFISSTNKGVTTTLGRGGSDYSASIVGAALKAEEVQIWTDVDGIMTTDPRIFPEAITIESITYAEAGELAFFGAKVVHPATIQPAVKHKIPLIVKNSLNPEGKGTSILPFVSQRGLKAITGKKSITLVSISSSNMLNAYGFLKNIFAIFDKYKTPVDLISTSEVSVSMTIENPDRVEEIVEELSQMGTVALESQKAILCLVGQELWKDSLFVSRVFSSINGTPIRMISLGASDTNLSIVIPEEKLNETIGALHREFF